MAEFELYQEALHEYQSQHQPTDKIEEKPAPASCEHTNIVQEKGMAICVDCGLEIEYRIDQDKEWRYYSQGDNKHVADPNRVQMRKIEERSIYKDVESLSFAESVVAIANRLYSQVTKGKIFRGKSRRAIVFGCIFHAYKMINKPQDYDTLSHIFNIERRTGMRGLKYVKQHAPKNSQIHTTYITPVNLVDQIMKQFSATEEQKQEVIQLYEQIKKKSLRLNRSRPLSVASAMVYYWIRWREKPVSIKDFANKVGLSELTITKIAKHISEILGTPEVL